MQRLKLASGIVIFAVSFSLGLASPQLARAQSPVRIFIANDDHTDFMWTANEAVYEQAFIDMLDFHLNLADQTNSNPAPYRNRFNADGSHWLWCYEQRRSPADFQRLMGRVKDGTISATLNALVSCYGGQPVEAVLRGMYYAGRLERRFDHRFRLAASMENQTLPLGLASLFAGAGAQYSWKGVCGCATRIPWNQLTRRPHEICWWKGPDGQRLLLKWHSISDQGNQRTGGYAEAFDPRAAIDFLDSDPLFLSRYRTPGGAEPYSVRAAFGYGWDALHRKTGEPNSDPTNYPLTDHFHEIASQESNDARQVVVSNQQDFFDEFKALYGSSLPSQSVTYGNEWDLYSASMAETSARVKRAVEKMRSAELLATFVSLKSPGFMTNRIAARDLAYRYLGLYWEHNWTADGPVSRNERAAWQERLAAGIENYVNSLYDDALLELGSLIPRPTDSFRFFVLNPLSWRRSEAVDIPYLDENEIRVRDITTDGDVPYQLVKRDGTQFLRILATNVPALGYRVYEVLPGPAAIKTAAAQVTEGNQVTLSNAAASITVERDGSISRLIDKRNGAVDFASQINGLRLNDLAPNTDAGQPLKVENAGPVSVSVRAQSGAGVPHITTITMYRNSNRIDIDNRIIQNFQDTKHWGFSFALNNPSTFSEEVGAINLNKLQSAGGAYANTQARYDYITLNHFADMNDASGQKGITLSNADLAFAKLGNSTPTSLDSSTPQIKVLAGGQVDGPDLGIPAQFGYNYFRQRFALRPHGSYDQAAAMRFSLEHQNPLIAGYINPGARTAYPETFFNLLAVNNPNVLLWSLKVHDDGLQKGLVARLWNMSNVAATATLTFQQAVSEAFRVTHIETDLGPTSSAGNSVSTFFAPQQLQSYRVRLGN